MLGDLTTVLCRAKGQPKAKTAVGDIPVSAVMLTNEELQKVAKHCNERKTAAKSCSVRPCNISSNLAYLLSLAHVVGVTLQDSSSRLYLSVLLRARPNVAEAIVISLNGNRFFDVYVPLLGLEARILVSEIKPTAESRWDPEQRCCSHTRNLPHIPCSLSLSIYIPASLLHKNISCQQCFSCRAEDCDMAQGAVAAEEGRAGGSSKWWCSALPGRNCKYSPAV